MATQEYIVTHELYEATLPLVLQTFSELERTVAPPRLVRSNGHLVYRFIERLPEQAILAKLSRAVTGLQSTWILLCAGFTQEAASIQRILDEISGDIRFLAGPLTIGQEEPNHKRFLDEFFQEEFEEHRSPIDSLQKRDRVPRRKIRAYNARTYWVGDDFHQANRVVGTIDDAYSGFVHAAGVHILDMFGGEPPHFNVRGLSGTSRADDAFADFRNYLHQALFDSAIASKALGHDQLFSKLRLASSELAEKFDPHVF